MTYDPASIEDRWRRRWAEEGRYEADPDDGEGTFVTVAYPYPSGGMHIGHARTYTVPDVYARYRRQQGDTVLFPIGWHVTGTPIIGAVERLKKGEEDQLSVLRDTYNVPEDTLTDLETPMGYARHFIEEHYKTGMKQLGLSIDWRREFTTEDDHYERFISWQYETLKERGLLEKGRHPVKYCTEQKQPVTTHDLLEGEDVEEQDYTLVKFSDEAGRIYPMATLRPETVRGVTNAFVNPDTEYVEATVDGETWVVSEPAALKLELQDHEVSVGDSVSGEDIVGRSVVNPITDESIHILPAEFVDPDSGTGVVMSVPAHSPDDYLALQEVKDRAEELADYGLNPDAITNIEPVPILSIDGYGEIPARDAVESAGIESSTDPALEDVTQELYTDEFHGGELIGAYGEFAGEVVADVRERFRDHYRETGAFGRLYDFPEPVVSRAGGEVVIAYQDTWFLRYNDEDWEQDVLRAIERIDAIPENTREQYEHTVDWLEEWPCIRNYGLGTPLPWDEDYIIEPLSDSTVYMAYYTVAHRLKELPPEDLDRNFFDALFYGEDAVEDPDPRALELREEWQYWYPVNYRCSGEDLINNHLTFYLYHHAELFDEQDWPEGIAVMGMGLLEGSKMSSSKGHVVLPDEAIGDYGADTVRFFLLNSSEPWQDFDWRADAVQSTHDQLASFYNRATDLIEGSVGRRDLEPIDEWLLAHLQETITAVTEAMENFETRTASQEAFYRFEEQLRWYRRRTDLDRPGARWTLRHVLETRLRLLAPIIPFMANELHERLTADAGEAIGVDAVSEDGIPAEDAPWPTAAPVDEGVLARESLVQDLTDDVADILEVTGEDPATIRVYVAADWKHEVFETVREIGPDVGAVMGEVMSDPDLRERGDAVNDLVQELAEDVRGLPEERIDALAGIDERGVYEDAADFLASEFDADVAIYAEDEDPTDPAGKAGQASPFRPAVHVE